MLYSMRASKGKFNSLSIRTGMIFSKLPLSPNHWTLISLIPAIATFVLLYYGELLLAAAAFFIAAAIDVIDGAVARVTGRVTPLGAYLDTVIDRIIEFSLIIGLAFVAYPALYFSSQLWILLLFFGGFLTTYVKSAAFEKKMVTEELHGGILERSERLGLLIAVLLASHFDPMWGMYLIAITTALTLISALQRFAKGIQIYKKRQFTPDL
jgi:archaetidylinositol phosphate synthase